MVDFALDEDARMLVDTVRAFAEKEIRPKLREFEAAKELPKALDAAFHGLGVSTLSLPEYAGGSGMGERMEILVGEELGCADLGTSFALPGPGAFAIALQLLGTEAQQKKWLSAFVDDASLRGAVAWSETSGHPDDGMITKATRSGDGFVLDGKKAPVLQGPKAGRFVVFAQVEGKGLDGVGAFVVERGTAGFEVGEHMGTLAFDAAGLAPLVLKGVKVPDENRLMGNGDFAGKLREFFVRAALRGAARIVGGARASYTESVSYAQTRTAFGKPIGHHQGLGFLLSDMATAVDAMRWLVWRAAWAIDTGQASALLDAAKAVAEVQESGMYVCNHGVQVHGGAGFIQDLPLEKWMREAKAAMSYGLTAQSADALVGELLLDRTPSLVDSVPAPFVQPVIL